MLFVFIRPVLSETATFIKIIMKRMMMMSATKTSNEPKAVTQCAIC